MATQRVIIAKIVGAAADAVFRRFHKCYESRGCLVKAQSWREKRTQARTRNDLEEFVSSLRAHSHLPPVAFYTEYVDGWSMGDIFVHPFSGRDARTFLHLAADELELMVYRLPDRGLLERTLRSSLRRKRVRERDPQETRWFLAFLLESLLSWKSLGDDGVLVVVRDILQPLTCDEDFERTLEDVPTWVAGKPTRKCRLVGAVAEQVGRRITSPPTQTPETQ